MFTKVSARAHLDVVLFLSRLARAGAEEGKKKCRKEREHLAFDFILSQADTSRPAAREGRSADWLILSDGILGPANEQNFTFQPARTFFFARPSSVLPPWIVRPDHAPVSSPSNDWLNRLGEGLAFALAQLVCV